MSVSLSFPFLSSTDIKALSQLATPQMADNYIKKNRGEIEARCRVVVAIEEIVDREKISLSDEEIEAEFKAARAGLEGGGVDVSEVRRAGGRRERRE